MLIFSSGLPPGPSTGCEHCPPGVRCDPTTGACIKGKWSCTVLSILHCCKVLLFYLLIFCVTFHRFLPIQYLLSGQNHKDWKPFCDVRICSMHIINGFDLMSRRFICSSTIGTFMFSITATLSK